MVLVKGRDMAKNTCCTFPYCEKAREPDRDTTMCEEHSSAWMRSEDFTKAARDENVRAAFSLGLKDMAMRCVAKYRRKWAKRVSAEEGGE